MLASDRVTLDIWNWKDPYLQPMQLVRANQERNRTYTAVAHLDMGTVVQLATEDLPSVRFAPKATSRTPSGPPLCPIASSSPGTGPTTTSTSWTSPPASAAWSPR